MRNINYSIAIVDHTTVYAKMGIDQFQTKFIGNRLKQIKQKPGDSSDKIYPCVGYSDNGVNIFHLSIVSTNSIGSADRHSFFITGRSDILKRIDGRKYMIAHKFIDALSNRYIPYFECIFD